MGSTSVPAPEEQTSETMARDISAFVKGYGQSLPQVLYFEKKFRPEFADLNIADIKRYQTGLQALQNKAAIESQRQLQYAKKTEIAGMTAQAGAARYLMKSASPEGAALVGQSQKAAEAAQRYAAQFRQEAQQARAQYEPSLEKLSTAGMTKLAERAYQEADTLSPEAIRNAQQAAREAGMASGRIGGTSTIAAEIMNREAAKAQRRSEAAQLGGLAFQQQSAAAEQQRAAQAQGFTQFSSLGQQNIQAQEAARLANQQAFGQAQSFYSSPVLSLLGSVPQNYAVGQQSLGSAMAMLGKSAPGLVSPDTGLNLAAAGRKDLLGAKSAEAQAKASQTAGIASGVGTIAMAKVFLMCIPSGETIDTVDGKKLIDDISPNDKIIGFNGDEVIVFQKHSYKENPEIKRFVKIQFDDNSSISLCDKHRVNHIESQNVKVGDCINKKTVVSIQYFGGVEISYDLLTSDAGYQMNGVPVNSMIPELIEKIIEITNKQ